MLCSSEIFFSEPFFFFFFFLHFDLAPISFQLVWIRQNSAYQIFFNQPFSLFVRVSSAEDVHSRSAAPKMISFPQHQCFVKLILSLMYFWSSFGHFWQHVWNCLTCTTCKLNFLIGIFCGSVSPDPLSSCLTLPVSNFSPGIALIISLIRARLSRCHYSVLVEQSPPFNLLSRYHSYLSGEIVTSAACSSTHTCTLSYSPHRCRLR